jgi:hypothetical protein
LRAFSSNEAAKANGTTINALLVLVRREGAVNVKTFNQWKQEGKELKREVKFYFMERNSKQKRRGKRRGSKF